MKASNPKEQIKEFIAQADAESAFAEFQKWLPTGSPLFNDLVFVQNQYNDLKRQMTLGLLTQEEWMVGNNKVNYGLINLLDRWQNDALELIQHALKSNATFLDLGNCSLSAIPSEIEQLTQLEELNLGSVYWDDTRKQFAGSRNEAAANDLSSERFEGLLKLKKLRKLSLRACNIKTLDGLDKLKQLHTLSVGQNDIKNIAHIAGLTNLKVLSLFGNNITDIQHLAALKKLELLSINDNAVVDLSPLSELQGLEELYASGNRIESIGPIASLPKLKTLNLDSNLIKHVEPLAYMTKLTTLNLNSNPIIDCPSEIAFSGDIHLIQTFFQAKERSAAKAGAPPDTELLDIEVELEDSHPVLEVKLILVGNSSAGKTSVSKLLRGLAFDAVESTTHGINVSEWMIHAGEITDWRSPDMPPYRIKVNLWDFGGQEYYHGTHRVFLDSNAVYVLVWSNDKNSNQVEMTQLYNEEGQPIEVPLEHFHYHYWLDNIRFHAPGNVTGDKPPIILLENKIDKSDGREHWYDRKILEQYNVNLTAAISAFYAQSEENNKRRYRYAFDVFREDLLRILVKKAEANSKIANLPAEWLSIRDQIRNIRSAAANVDSGNPFLAATQEHAWISLSDFTAACRKVRAELTDNEIEKLADFLHQTGVVVWMAHIDRQKIYIDPGWLTEKMYRVLNERVRLKNGRFGFGDILPALANDSEETSQMLSLMQEWRIIFQESNNTQDWVAPQYLPDEHPMENLFTIALAGLQENFYMFRAPLFHIRRILRHLVLHFGKHEQVEAREYWKYGVLFVVRPPLSDTSAQNERLRIFIKSLPDEKDPALGKLMVCIEPAKKLTEGWRELIFREILVTFNEALLRNMATGSVSGIPLREVAKQRDELYLSLNGQDFASIQRIVGDAEAGFSAVLSDERRRIPMPEFAALLRAVEITPPAPSLFISYSHADTELRKAMDIHLGALRRLGKVISWSDGQLEPGKDWNEAILRNLRSADIVLLLVSPDSLDSDYIWKVEIAEAMKRQEQGKCRVIPVLLRPCDWKEMAFSKLEVSPKDPRNARPKPVSLWQDQDEAFSIVVQGIKKALKELAVV